MASIERLEARVQSKPSARKGRCRVAEALEQYTNTGRDDERLLIEQQLERDRKDMPDEAIRQELKDDGIEAFAESEGPQSVSYHRSKRCICFKEQN